MKNLVISSKYSKTVPATLAFAAFTFLANASNVHGRGTDILHFSTRTAATNDGVFADASGRVEVSKKAQGKADHEWFNLTARGLEKNERYTVFALVGDNTNLTQIAEFGSDRNGRANLRFRDNGNGHKVFPVPGALAPITDVRLVSVFNSSTQSVFSADLTNPDKLQYLIKRNLSTPSVGATLRIRANGNKTQFVLTASGLAPSSDYLLAFNGGVVEIATTDDSGRLRIDSPLAIPADILNLQSLALWDSVSNVVFSTTLP